MKIVLANGCFELCHYGHRAHLKAAKKLGDMLIVAVTRDRSVNKGPGRPVFNEEQREAMLRDLRYVSGTMLVDDPLEALEILRPDIWALGEEYKGNVQISHLSFCERNSIEIAYTKELVYSSSELLGHSMEYRETERDETPR